MSIGVYVGFSNILDFNVSLTIHDQADDLMIAKLDVIPDGSTNKKELPTIKKFEDIGLSLNAKMDMLVFKAFNIYQQLLSHFFYLRTIKK